MTNYNRLYDGVSKAAWGYFFLYFDFSIGTVSLLPSFVGFLLFLQSIEYLKEEERDLSLLRPLGIILALWHGAEWLACWFGADLDGVVPFLDLIIELANLYFHFQLLTNMASLAANYQPLGASLDERLLKYRTLQTVMLTGMIMISYFSAWLTEIWAFARFVMAIIYLIAAICLMKALFDLRRCFKDHSLE